MENLRAKRQTLKGSITRIYNFCQNPNANIDELKVRILKLDDLFAQYEIVQDQIDALTTEVEALDVEVRYRSDIEDKYFMAKSNYSSRLREEDGDRTVIHNEPPDNISQVIQAMADSQTSMGVLLERLTLDRGLHSTPINNTTISQPHEPRLPQVQIPEFDGSYTEWIRFRDLFDAMIHTRTTISKVEKLEYLQTKLKGEALSLIKHLKPTNDNYLIAWQLLNDKYDKSEHVRRAYLELLFDQPAMKAATVIETKRVFNNTNESVNALKVLDEPIQHWDSVLLFHLEKKLDSETHILWCREKRTITEQKYKAFLKFMEDRIFELESIQQNVNKQTLKTSTPVYRTRNTPGTYSSTVQTCVCCSEHHFLYQCDKFRELSVGERYQVVRQHNMCFNCLRSNHLAVNCKGSSCRVCNAKHNTLLHFPPIETDNQRQILIQNSETQQSQQPSFTVNTFNRVSESVTILPTVIIMVRDRSNQLQPCRALLDSGAQATLISEPCLQRLRLKRLHDKTLMFGVGPNQSSYTKGKVNLQIVSTMIEGEIMTQAYCLSTLTKNIPSHNISSRKFEFFSNIKLADPQFNKSSQIDIIMGADLFGECLLPDRITHPSGSPVAISTIFGWVIMGKVEAQESPTVFAAHVSLDLNENLQKFWEIEDVSTAVGIMTDEEKRAEAHFQQNFRKLDNGRFMVKLPFKDDKPELGESRSAALKRLQSMERRFKNNNSLKNEYVKFIREYLQLHHMEIDESANNVNGYFMPHHAVMKPSSTTTKLRVVFDASCPTSNGESLNDQLLVGPTIQNDLFTILLKFRKYEIGISADIEKMYRQVLIHPEDKRFQRILWRESPDEPVKEYCLNTITYGTSSAPFLAVRTLHQISLENAVHRPAISEAIAQQFYVDDFMSCSENVQSAILLKQDLCSVLSGAGFNLRKWSSNSEEFMHSVSLPDRAKSTETIIDSTLTVKTLGLLWDTTTDSFGYEIVFEPLSGVITKRSVLSDIAKIFDPIGLLAPIVISMKIFMQKLWLHGINWDQQLPENLFDQWRALRDDIHNIRELRISRWVKFQDDAKVELHGFADSSELAYAAVIYLRVELENGDVFTSLITSKTRVAPVKQISLPRLELCAAQLMVKLMIKVKHALNFEGCKVFGWSDSTVVLAWLSDHPRRWKSFVANRTSYIIERMPAHQWHHISSRNNPADLATRGLSASQLMDNNLWWHGPDELRTSRILNESFPNPPDESDMERRNEGKTVSLVIAKLPDDIFRLYSEYNRLVRTTALILRFIHNCKSGKQNRTTSFLTSRELQKATYQLVKAAQHQSYASELRTLSAGKQLPVSHKLNNLAPFIDGNGLMRVGGRIENAQISYDQKHPMILDKDHIFTGLLVENYHLKYLHVGHRQMLYLIGLKFWIPHVTYVVKRYIYKCVTCMRFRAIPYQQQMANLPTHRLQQTAAFINTGVDFAGPIHIRSWKGRGSRLYKSWIAIFVCLGTKAIHLELVTELSTAACIAALRRFVSRRGKPLHMYSDNGTNFVGCNQQLRELHQFLQQANTQHALQKETCDQHIQWHFSPPSAPHFGGMWEAGVKSTKYHLKRVLADSSITFEEMYTVLCQVECCLNSRPLCIKFEGDLDPLTPGHFLIFRPMVAVPDEDLTNIRVNHCDRWQYLQKVVQGFWRKWSREYLNQLQTRPKWSRKLENLKIDDIVIIIDDNLAPTKWSIAKVIETHPGADGLVRVVTLKTSKGCYKRPITKVCPLFIDF